MKGAVQLALDGEQYRCILADPPWAERGGGKIKRGADRHYPLMDTPRIIMTMGCCKLWRPAESCHLWLWVTNNFLQDGLFLMDTLGFRYVTNLAWVKPGAPGLGQYFRGAHELLLFGTRGPAMVPPPARRLSTVIEAPRGRHSEKPAVAYERIEAVSPGPRLELFARARREGWDSWGNEVQ